MACTSCSGGCSTKTAEGETSTGGCNGGCATGGCNKMNTFDWLSDMQLPVADKYPFIEIRFKGGRKEFFLNTLKLELYTGDAVTVEMAGGGYHVGFVSLQGELVRLQMMRKKVRDNDPEIKSILRKSSEKDLEKLAESRNRELPSLFRSRQIIDELKLNMKLSDVEFQSDLTKACFYYSAEDRVDFRELIKLLAGEFKLRIDMRQISLRQEAGRLGGIGSCGRELCCSTWLTDFKSVTTSAARYQNLSLNPAKLSGNCGRLKCCLNYELDTYVAALKTIPNVDKPLETENGPAFLQKTDIFRRIMWFGMKGMNEWIALPIERVEFLLSQNKAGIKITALSETQEQALIDAENAPAKNDDLNQLDKKYAQKDKDNRKARQNPAKAAHSPARDSNTSAPFKKDAPKKQHPASARTEAIATNQAKPKVQVTPFASVAQSAPQTSKVDSGNTTSAAAPNSDAIRQAREERFKRQREAQASAAPTTESAASTAPKSHFEKKPFVQKQKNNPNFKKREDSTSTDKPVE